MLQNRKAYLKINEEEFEDKLNLTTLTTTTIKEHDLTFSGNRTAKGCTGTVTVYNLDFEYLPETELSLEIWGGYEEEFLIFKGDVLNIENEKVGSDRVTIFQVSDGAKLNEAESFSSAISSTSIKNTIKAMLKELKKAGAETADYIMEKVNSLMGNKKTQKSKAKKKILQTIDEVLAGYDKEARTAIHNGVVDILVNNEIGGETVVLNPTSGLVGSVKKSYNIEKKQSTIRATALLSHNYKVGEKIDVDGLCVIESISYSVSNFTPEFYANIEGLII